MSFKLYLDDVITTDNFQPSNFVGTIRKIKKKKNGSLEYEYAGNNETMIEKNPDGSIKKKKKNIDGPLMNIQSRPLPQVKRGKI